MPTASFGRRPPISTCVVASTEFDVRPGPKIKLAIDGIGCVRPEIAWAKSGIPASDKNSDTVAQ
jgi:hypothetical protein